MSGLLKAEFQLIGSSPPLLRKGVFPINSVDSGSLPALNFLMAAARLRWLTDCSSRRSTGRSLSRNAGGRLPERSSVTGLPDLLCQRRVSLARLSLSSDSRRRRGCGEVGSVVCFPLLKVAMEGEGNLSPHAWGEPIHAESSSGSGFLVCQ